MSTAADDITRSKTLWDLARPNPSRGVKDPPFCSWAQTRGQQTLPVSWENLNTQLGFTGQPSVVCHPQLKVKWPQFPPVYGKSCWRLQHGAAAEDSYIILEDYHQAETLLLKNT